MLLSQLAQYRPIGNIKSEIAQRVQALLAQDKQLRIISLQLIHWAGS